jgi:anion-transporting  ArsA/GET3 family ATPase
MERVTNEMQKLVYSCFKEIADHAMQSEVLSPQIKRINDNLKKISSLIEELDVQQMLTKNTEARHFSSRDFISGNEKQDIIKVAYALSRFDYYLINEILQTQYNQSEVFQFLSEKLKVKLNTLKNYRDMFDPYVRQERSNRKGWYQKELSSEFEARKSLWDVKEESYIKAEIEKIIATKIKGV